MNQGLVKPQEIPVSFGNAASVDVNLNESLQDLNWEIFLGSALADGTPLVGSTFDSGKYWNCGQETGKKKKLINSCQYLQMLHKKKHGICSFLPKKNTNSFRSRFF